MIVTNLQITLQDHLTYEKATVIHHRDTFYLVYSYGNSTQKIKEDRNYITEVCQIYPTLNSGNPFEWDRGAIIYQREVPTPEDHLADEAHDFAVSKYSQWF